MCGAKSLQQPLNEFHKTVILFVCFQNFLFFL